MAIRSYKCPSCGAGIEFKPALQKFKCDFCLSEYTEEEIAKIYPDLEENLDEEIADKQEEHLAVYQCNSCGAEVVTDDTTASTFCYYCHNPVILSDRLSGNFEPKKMIPFTINKEKAQETFLKWASKNKFVPKEFYSNSQLEKITGIYLPYWWADYKISIDYLGQANQVRVWRVGDRQHTETKKYEIVRKGSLDINNVEELAFTKIDHTLLNGIAPYNESQAVDFSMPYLSGFFAEQYDIDKEAIVPKIEDQVNQYTDSLIRDTISGFNNVRERHKDFKVLSKKMNYTLLPAWILTYQYGGKTYVFAVNGQTGKSFGELPLDTKKTLSVSAIIFTIVFVLALLGGAFLW